MSEETKKGFRMPSSYTVLIIIIAVMAALTWIIPAGQYDVNKEGNLIAGTYKQVASNGTDSCDAWTRTYKGSD